MREIKFRAWEQKKYIMYDWKFLSNLICDTLKDFFDHDSMIVLQYTGLKDKNGVEIYEGDIVKYHQAEYNEDTELHEDRITVCEWYEDQFSGIQRTKEGVLISPHSYLRTKVIEVIGNIYENPELLS